MTCPGSRVEVTLLGPSSMLYPCPTCGRLTAVRVVAGEPGLALVKPHDYPKAKPVMQ